jgi:hypothetical protein
MALVIVGRSRCALCEGVLEDGQDVTAFPAFLPPKHRLWRYSDAAFHARCFIAWTERSAFEALYQRAQALWNTRPRDLTTTAEMDAWGREASAWWEQEAMHEDADARADAAAHRQPIE